MSIMRCIIASWFFLFFLSSCQKDLSLDTGTFNNGSGGGGNGGSGGSGSGLLVKTVITTLFDTTTTLFTYDVNKKLVSQSIVVQGPLSSGDFRKHITRDAQDRVSVLVDSSAKAGGWDTTRTTIFYSGSTNTALYAVAKTSSTDIDSIVFTYTATRITKLTYYEYVGASQYAWKKEVVFGYDGSGNINNIKNYVPPATGSTPMLETESSSTFDNKVSPLNFGNDGLIIYAAGAIDGGENTVGPNNSLVTNDIDHTSTSGIDVTTIAYTYLSNNKPSKAAVSFVPSGLPAAIPSNITFYYQ